MKTTKLTLAATLVALATGGAFAQTTSSSQPFTPDQVNYIDDLEVKMKEFTLNSLQPLDKKVEKLETDTSEIKKNILLTLPILMKADLELSKSVDDNKKNIEEMREASKAQYGLTTGTANANKAEITSIKENIIKTLPKLMEADLALSQGIADNKKNIEEMREASKAQYNLTTGTANANKAEITSIKENIIKTLPKLMEVDLELSKGIDDNKKNIEEMREASKAQYALTTGTANANKAELKAEIDKKATKEEVKIVAQTVQNVGKGIHKALDQLDKLKADKTKVDNLNEQVGKLGEELTKNAQLFEQIEQKKATKEEVKIVAQTVQNVGKGIHKALDQLDKLKADQEDLDAVVSFAEENALTLEEHQTKILEIGGVLAAHTQAITDTNAIVTEEINNLYLENANRIQDIEKVNKILNNASTVLDQIENHDAVAQLTSNTQDIKHIYDDLDEHSDILDNHADEIAYNREIITNGLENHADILENHARTLATQDARIDIIDLATASVVNKADKNKEDIKHIYDDLDEHSDILDNHADVLIAHSEAISELDDDVSTLSTNLEATDNEVAQNKAHIERVDAAAGFAFNYLENVKADKETVAELDDDVSALIENLETTDNEVAQNKADIATTKTEVAQNKANIATNKNGIQANRSKIAVNEQNIAVLDAKKADKTVVLANTQAIEANAQAIRVHTTRLTNVESLANRNSARIDQLDNRVNKLHSKLKSGLAAQAALNGLFQPYNVGKVNVTAAIGGHQSKTAIAVGAGYRINQNVAVKTGIAFGTSKNVGATYNVGVNFEW